MGEQNYTRRTLIKSAVLALSGSQLLLARAGQAAPVEPDEANVSPAEDLMREHGLLNRILLIYEACVQRLKHAQSEFDPNILRETAELTRDFIENYHEKLEEQYLFPRFEKAQKLTDLVATLRKQHLAGRVLTAAIITDTVKARSRAEQLISALEAFNRMYRPHESREDTVLFTAFRELVSEKEYGELGELFEDKEHELFGKDGFERNVAKVAALEKRLDIYDLDKFAARLKNGQPISE